MPPAPPPLDPAAQAPEAPPYRWTILAVCPLLVALNSVPWHSFSLFLVALKDEFGWARGEVALGFLIFVLCIGLTGPNAGYLVGRFGATRVMIGGAVLLAIGLAATSRVTVLWQFYLSFGLITAVGSSLAGWVPIVTIIQTWFRRRMGPAIGVVSAGAGVGIMALVPATQIAIQSVGWRSAYLIMAGVTLCCLVPLAFLLRTGPLARLAGVARGGAPPIEDPLVVDRAWVARPWTLRSAVRERRYLFFFAGVFLTTFASQQVLSHQAAYLNDAGYSLLLAATLSGVIGLASVPAKIGWGVLSDRIGREATYSIGGLLITAALVTMWVIPALRLDWLPYLYAVLIGWGYAVNATITPTMAADMFRGAAYGALFGGIQFASSAGSGVGSWLAGFIFDQTGSYYLAFALAIAGVIAGAVCIWLAGPRHVRRVPGRVPSPASQIPGQAPVGAPARA